MSQEAYDKAMEKLEEIEKSQSEDEGTDDLDALTKSLEEELSDEELSKGHKEPDGDEDVEDEDGDGDGEPEDEDCEKSVNDDFDDELVKASEAYNSLEKSVHTMAGSIHEELDVIRKSMAALMNLNIKQAKVIGALVKSRQEDMDRIAKSVGELWAAPAAPNKAVLGMGESEHVEKLEKSVSEVTDLLTKAVSQGKVDARWLSTYGTYKDASRLPDEVKTIIGL